MANFACGLRVTDTKPRKEKLVKRGHGLGHVTYFLNFGTTSLKRDGKNDRKVTSSRFSETKVCYFFNGLFLHGSNSMFHTCTIKQT